MRKIAPSILLLLMPTGVLASLSGRVVSTDGVSIEHARVETTAGTVVTYTNARGEFSLGDAEIPVDLLISHPRFKDVLVDGSKIKAGRSLLISMEAKQKIYEEIAVTAQRGEQGYAPISVAAAVVDPKQAETQTLAELVSEVPGVSENGQGGLFQTYSVRGVSRLRVLTLVDGMRVVSERRAGISASFVDPGLMGSIEVLKGPSSTYYGSGALGGVVQLFPREFDRLVIETGYQSQGDGRHFVLGAGNGTWSFGLAHREADNSETPSGEELNSAFAQTSAVYKKAWADDRLAYRLTALATLGEDIGKANTDFPERTTVYPREQHVLIRFAVEKASRWQFDMWAHPNGLDTRVVEASGESSELENRSLDFGTNWQTQRSIADQLALRLGADYFGRRAVDAREEIRDPASTEVVRSLTLDSGEEDEFGLYGALEWSVGKAVVLSGGRLVYQRQRNGDAASIDDSAVTAFVGLVQPIANGFELVANLGTGLRFPSLSERFFSGTTGRGEIEANPELDPERSLNADFGLRWYGSRLFFSSYFFRNRIDEYIERIEVEPEILTFRNLTSGVIEGVELEGALQLGRGSSLSFGGHLVSGRDNANRPLGDIPADSVFLGGRWVGDRWSLRGRWEYRAAKSDLGSGEKSIPAANLITAGLSYAVGDDLELLLNGRNLLDEEYFNSADRKVPFAAGRSIGFSLAWERP